MPIFIKFSQNKKMPVHSFGKTKIDFNFTPLLHPISNPFWTSAYPLSLKDLVVISIRKLKIRLWKKLDSIFRMKICRPGWLFPVSLLWWPCSPCSFIKKKNLRNNSGVTGYTRCPALFTSSSGIIFSMHLKCPRGHLLYPILEQGRHHSLFTCMITSDTGVYP